MAALRPGCRRRSFVCRNRVVGEVNRMLSDCLKQRRETSIPVGAGGHHSKVGVGTQAAMHRWHGYALCCTDVCHCPAYTVAWVIGGGIKSFLMHLRRHSCHAPLQNPQSAERVLGVAVVAQCL
eukprot:2005226-Pyramimonas_sp.AAC.1